MNDIIRNIINYFSTDNVTNRLSKESKEHLIWCDSCYLYIYEKGIYYGYPPCCIEAFIQSMCGGAVSERQYVVSKDRFIPCRYHTIQIENGRINIEDLISPERKATTKFANSTKNGI